MYELEQTMGVVSSKQEKYRFARVLQELKQLHDGPISCQRKLQQIPVVCLLSYREALGFVELHQCFIR